MYGTSSAALNTPVMASLIIFRFQRSLCIRPIGSIGCCFFPIPGIQGMQTWAEDAEHRKFVNTAALTPLGDGFRELAEESSRKRGCCKCVWQRENL